MTAVRAAYPHRFRPRRYVIATFLIGVVVVLVTASSLASALFSGATLQVFLFGLPSLALLIAGTAFGLRGLSEPGTIRRRGLLRAAVLLGLGLVFWALVAESSLVFHGVSPGTVLACALACVPTTGFALWVVRRMDRNEKEPWRVMLAAVIWGGVVATTLALWGNELWSLLITNNIPPGAGANQSLGLSAGIVEEISKGLAVLLLYLLVRNEFDGLVDGIVYGAVVGLGFNFMESLIYMSTAYVDVQAAGGPGAAGAAIQWGLRQVLGLFFGHATYTAMAGAGIGIARQMPRMHQRVLAIASGFVAAIAAHMVWDSWIASAALPANEGLSLIVVVARELLGNAPFTAAVLLLLGMGLHAEGNALELHLAAEAETGMGAVLPPEIRLLRSPWRRLGERLDVLLQRGPKAWLQVGRLRSAQLDLAMERWHRARQEIDEPMEAEEVLRQRVLDCRAAFVR